jgi:hypothetical protein
MSFKIKVSKKFSALYAQDAKHLGISLARYKFVSKMFDGYENILEVGAGEGFKSQVVKQVCKKLTLSDIYAVHKRNCFDQDLKKNYLLHNFCKKKLYEKKETYDGIFFLDVGTY